MTSAAGYDVIGDIHGYADKLVGLLEAMGYAVDPATGAYAHPSRQAVFVGDLIDRGPAQLAVVDIVRAMIDAGSAQIVIGNHEFNAVAYATPDPDEPGAFLRRHTPKNTAQHQAFLDQAAARPSAYADLIAWFQTLPLWLDLDGLRVIHACWDAATIDRVRPLVGPADNLTPALVVAASRPSAPEYTDVELLLKGPEIDLAPHAGPYVDKGGHTRDRARFQWWLPDAGRLDVGALIPGGTTDPDGHPYPPLPPVPIEPPVAPYAEPVPVVFGHYWRTGAPARLSPTTACVDYSAGLGGPLVAYRWSGETTFVDDCFFSFPGMKG